MGRNGLLTIGSFKKCASPNCRICIGGSFDEYKNIVKMETATPVRYKEYLRRSADH